MGRNNEAITERKLAQELDPLSLVISFELGTAFYYARDYDQAIGQFQKTLELEPNFPLVHQFLPAAYEQKGMYAEAIAGFKKAAVRGDTEWSYTMAGLGHVYAVSGKKVEARAVLDELKQLSSQEYVPADAIAVIYGAWASRSRFSPGWKRRTSTHLKWLGSKWTQDGTALRDDPRFADLVRRVGL
ncbi:MAG: tetratricopeptide repeat protein [Pyrinomonadaceae bacterium]|nr:tetratricopeptide repeat protein [Pyrinomonadaceae bacterium]